MSCSYYKWQGGFFGDYWCDKKNTKVDSDIYERYCKSWSYDECPIYKEKGYTGGCFLTTVVCDVLKKDDKDIVLETMRNFRNNVLQKNQQYFNILKDYDYIGPVLAYKFGQDENREEIAQRVYQGPLLTITSLINKKEYKQAIECYQSMTLSFIDHYGFRETYEKNRKMEYELREFNPETAGHGVLQKRLFQK